MNLHTSDFLDRSKTPAIMVVGTTSNAGKSIVAAGLCRLLARRGMRVAPFKAQNMALNSFVTREGGEMGRSQVTQAFAAGLQPHTDMNPVLLKPMSGDGSQAIVDGHSIGNLKTGEYVTMKRRMRAAALAAYDRLSGQYDIMVIEGAGSPAEINLMADDFVNMQMAAYANARTILVADIDRGGAFAAILGTVLLLPPDKRALLAGIVINKFRGDVSQLDSAITQIEELTGISVLGVLPFVHDLQIEDEDSVSLDDRHSVAESVLDIAVIRLPHISNFTDYLAMEGDDGIGVRYVETAAALGTPDLIILPGTKHTRSDLEWLHATQMGARIIERHHSGTPVFGICGGYQMLGTQVQDPEGVEGPSGTTSGLDLLQVTTSLQPHKELALVTGATTSALPFTSPGTPFSGYEIHAGTTTAQTEMSSPLTLHERRSQPTREPCGAISADGLAFGCYVHGLFDQSQIRTGLWQWLCSRTGVAYDNISMRQTDTLAALDRWADIIEQHMTLETILKPAI